MKLKTMFAAALAGAILCASAAFAQTPIANATPVAVTGTAATVTIPVISNPGPLYRYYVSNWGAPISACTGPIMFTYDGTTASATNGTVLGPNTGAIVPLPKVTSMSVISIGSLTGCTFYVSIGVGTQP